MPGSGLVTMIDDDRIPDLHRLYELFGRPLVPEGLEVLKLALKKTIQARGVAINASVLGPDEANKSASTDEPAQVEAEVVKTKKPILSGAAAVAAALRWVQEVVDLKDKFDKILKEAFEENKGVQMSMNEASYDIGLRRVISAELTWRTHRLFKPLSTRIPDVKSSSHYSSMRT